MKKIQFLFLFLSGMVYFVSSSWAQEQPLKKFSLKEAQEYAIKNSYQTQNAVRDIQIAKLRVNQTTGIGLPQVSASVSYNNFINIPTQLMPNFLTPAVDGVLLEHGLIDTNQMLPMSGDKFKVQFGSKHTATANITASQLIFDGSYIVGLQAAKVYVELSQNGLAKSEIETKETVAQSYYLILVALENRRVLAASIENLNKTLYETQQLYDNGFVEDSDVDQLQLMVSSLRSKQNMVDRQIELAYNLLKYQMGLGITEKIDLTDKLDYLVADAIAENLVQQQLNYNKHIDIKSLNTQKQLLGLNLKKDRYAYLPTMSAFYSYEWNAQRNKFNFFESGQDWFKTNILGFSLNIPLWSSGIRSTQVKMDKIELQKINTTIEQVKQGLVLDVENNRSSLKTFTDQYINDKENMELSEKIYEKNLLKYHEGVTSSLDLTQAHNQYLTSQGTYFNTLLELLNSKSKLTKALNNY
ncbi:MAG: TolC family protein [Lentimicrobiaceae bacterium]|nr:TolC family protein [Lentimicrobiaceae bacterium]